MELLSGISFVPILMATLILGIGIAVGKHTKSEGESFLAKVFSNNQELDTTIRYIGILGLAFAMVYFFHDDIKAEAGIIIVSLFNVITNGNGSHKGA